MPGRPQDAAQTGEGTGGVAVLADCLPAGRPGCRLSVFIERAFVSAASWRWQRDALNWHDSRVAREERAFVMGDTRVSVGDVEHRVQIIRLVQLVLEHSMETTQGDLRNYMWN